MFKLGKYLKSYTWLIIIGPLLKLLATLGGIVSPIIVAKMIDEGLGTGNSKLVIELGLIVVGITILALVLDIIAQKCSSIISEGVGRDIRKSMFRHINTYSHKEFDRFTTMSLTNRSVHDVDQVQTAISMTIRQITRAPFLLVGSIIMALIIDPQLSLIFVVVSPILFLVVFLIMKRNSPMYLKSKEALDEVSNVTRENLSGVRVVRAFNKQEFEEERFKKSNSKLLKYNLKIGNLGALLGPLLGLIINFAIVAIIWIGGIRVNIGGVSQGEIVAFINYFGQTSGALVSIARILLIYTRTGASMKRISEVFEVKNSVKETRKPVALDLTKPASIEFKNVSFAYLNTKNVVNNLSFSLKPGQTLGIIGGTGSGKSSVVNLIPRLYDVGAGEVLINGVNVKKYRTKDLRKYIGVVPQKAVLFKGTLAENMRWRDEHATDEEIIKALKTAQAYKFVSENPEFLKAKVERGGTNFSGGQKQRLTIARALVGEPKILILDDSSSALDFATDASLRKAIYKDLKGITTVIVSQRTNSIKNCDQIIVLENGNVVGTGKHAGLMRKCPVYKEIYDSQNKERGE